MIQYYQTGAESSAPETLFQEFVMRIILVSLFVFMVANLVGCESDGCHEYHCRPAIVRCYDRSDTCDNYHGRQHRDRGFSGDQAQRSYDVSAQVRHEANTSGRSYRSGGISVRTGGERGYNH